MAESCRALNLVGREILPGFAGHPGKILPRRLAFGLQLFLSADPLILGLGVSLIT
jgi:hypothetical protein